MKIDDGRLTATHWGNFRVRLLSGDRLQATPLPNDPAPSAIGRSLAATRDPGCRIAQPMVRESYLRQGKAAPGSGRGREPFVPVSWDTALGLAADAIGDIRARRGDSAVYGSSYGWASAGRFHHAQSQIHRFLRQGGGYTDSVNDYSAGAAQVIVPRITGMSFYIACQEAPSAADIAAHCKLIVCFGGMGVKNNEMSPGGIGLHRSKDYMAAVRAAGVEVLNISAIDDDASADLNAQWWPCRPGSDVALMLALAHTLIDEKLHDLAFLSQYCVGFERFAAYLMGQSDGQAKTAEWASALTGVDAARIRELARRMASRRTLIGLSLSMQRQQHGEQSYWAATTLAAMLGHIGLPGGGIAYGYGVLNMSFMERRRLNFSVGALPQGSNAVRDFIPVSRLTDMLERPGDEFDYNGQRFRYPDIGLIYWAGGNPFHHHQDLNRLERAWAAPETIIVNEMFWTATARRADIVLPSASTLERNDFSAASGSTFITPMHRVVEPYAQARTDFQIFTGLARRLGYEDRFTEGRDEMAWVRHLYEVTTRYARDSGVELPDFDTFWRGEPFDVTPQLPVLESAFEAFRADPVGRRLRTPSGRIELFSETIAGFGYDDCVGHAAWYDKAEWHPQRLARWPLHLVSSQPATRLHSQLDHGEVSRERKIEGREPIRMNPRDAAARGIKAGDVVRVFNDRGATLAGVIVSEALMPGVVQLPTGAWFDSLVVDGAPLEIHGNPNALTRDAGTSRLAQACSAHSCQCEVERYEGELPPIRVFSQPDMVEADRADV